MNTRTQVGIGSFALSIVAGAAIALASHIWLIVLLLAASAATVWGFAPVAGRWWRGELEDSDMPFSGGKGGTAKAKAGAKAQGGKGGAAGTRGPGGDGGHAEAEGKGSMALGGEGGEGARHDRASKGGRGPFDVLNHPDRDVIVPGTNMRLGDFGRGGDGAPPPKKRD